MKQELLNGQIYYYKSESHKETILHRLREHGYRITKQRKVLLDIILEHDCASCKEMYYKVNMIEPSIGMATVYRMVNVLEEIGVFSRRNMYKISCGMGCVKENVCQIKFEDNTYCHLSAKLWYKVISEGLKQCGYGDGRRIIGVEAQVVCSDIYSN